MRKEREWKRTLACKLYEERITFKLHDERAVDVKGGEEMDLLWEAYEKQKQKQKQSRRGGRRREEEDGSVRQVCCLKALKLSTGNMNLGVGRPNLMKISKVLKGMRMFQHFGKHSNSRKK
uniref:Uncharacterized protein n=1 Tax=Ananas comosus var. bracteatus TaxID=296719 RepID=A0A6V7P0T0_ANACO|nr:unnamed protein product [Ananas comosus var. bracteatus]